MTMIAAAGVAPDEMRRTFNLGLGMLIVVAAASANEVLELLTPERARVVGALQARRDQPVVFLA